MSASEINMELYTKINLRNSASHWFLLQEYVNIIL